MIWSWGKVAAGVVNIVRGLMRSRHDAQQRAAGAAKQRDLDNAMEAAARRAGEDEANEIKTVDDATAAAIRRVRE